MYDRELALEILSQIYQAAKTIMHPKGVIISKKKEVILGRLF